ncbi:MAG: RNase adapter RapZ [Methylococcaceae bacterium]|nr:RNase adapter RapZ [Methylococcaceae bacterium]
MKLLIVSGLSGSGKSIALDTLEDCGYYCVDNLPVTLLELFVTQILQAENQAYSKTAIGIDARDKSTNLADFGEKLAAIRELGIDCEIIYMQAEESVLLKRYSETRRRHPLSNQQTSLTEAIQYEKQILRTVSECADVLIDTSRTHYHQLRELIKSQVDDRDERYLSLQFQSFGFKHGIPLDADFIFDARSLPNPYWIPDLRGLNGNDQPVIDFLQSETYVKDLFNDIADFIQRWAPRFEADNRSYLTIAIGCTGGQHRSVYLINALAKHFQNTRLNVIVRHRELY